MPWRLELALHRHFLRLVEVLELVVEGGPEGAIVADVHLSEIQLDRC